MRSYIGSLFLILGVILAMFSLSFAQTDRLVITSYYPSPMGVYSEVRIVPKAAPSLVCAAATNSEGVMYYSSANQQLAVCTNMGGTFQWGLKVDQLRIDGKLGVRTNAPLASAVVDINGSVRIGTVVPPAIFGASGDIFATRMMAYQSLRIDQFLIVPHITVPPNTDGVQILASTWINGNLDIQGNLSKLGGAFLIDHPLDPKNKILRHSFVESPDMKNIYDGVVVLDDKGEAIVQLPDYFAALNESYRYQLTSIGGYAPIYVKEEIKNNKFVISGGYQNLKVSWMVTGIRKDAYALKNRIVVEEEKGVNNTYKKGEYVYPPAYLTKE